jgi:hypothetical protein
MGTVTNYLKLRFIALKSTDWFSDFNFNLGRIDLLGKLLRLQAGPGQSSALRCELVDGTLAEYVRAVPNGSGVDIYVGRPGSTDRVILRSTGGSIGETLTETWAASAAPIPTATASVEYTVSPILALTDGQWDVTADVGLFAKIVGAAADAAIDVTVSILANGFAVATGTFTVAQVLANQRQAIHITALGLPGNTDYTVSMRYEVIVNGTHTSVTLGILKDAGSNYISATRVA